MQNNIMVGQQYIIGENEQQASFSHVLVTNFHRIEAFTSAGKTKYHDLSIYQKISKFSVFQVISEKTIDSFEGARYRTQ